METRCITKMDLADLFAHFPHVYGVEPSYPGWLQIVVEPEYDNLWLGNRPYLAPKPDWPVWRWAQLRLHLARFVLAKEPLSSRAIWECEDALTCYRIAVDAARGQP